MALFSLPELKTEAQRLSKLPNSFYASELRKSDSQVSPDQEFHIFMSHSILDADIVYTLRNKIMKMGYSIYIDWIMDGQLDRSKVDKETALILKLRMKNCSCLLFTTSDNSPSSTWMPWELGYFDGLKERVAILPLLDSPTRNDIYKGQEYLGLYPYVTINPDTKHEESLFINESPKKYINFDSWLEGKNPQEYG